MKPTSAAVFLISLLIIINSNIFAQGDTKASKWPKSVTYEIFVQSFADSNHDGIGDFNGMTSKLDYIKDLGVEAVWLMPIHPSPSYHKYDVDDYYNVHPDYGTLKDFKRFVDEAHKRGIHVVIDLVINHSGRGNLWFREALKDDHIKYWDYYVWAHKDDPQVLPPEGQKWSNWRTVPGSNYLYFAFFDAGMPDLNYDNPKLRQEIFNIGRFWLSEMNIDGFRLDAARHIYPDERARDSQKWWEYFLQEMKKIKSDVYIVGEVWADFNTAAPYLKGIPALFDFDMGSAIIKAVNDEKGNQLAVKHREIIEAYKSVNPDYIDNTFLTNHDQDRILSSVNGNINKAKIAASLLFTLPGSPYIYYGEEIGMLGKKPDELIREPFLWDIRSRDSSRTKWEVPHYSNDTTVTPLSVQLTDENSLFNHYKNLIKLRNYSPALTTGDLTPVTISNQSICAFTRNDPKQSLLVIHNLSGTSQNLKLPSEVQKYKKVYYSTGKGQVKNRQAELPAFSTIIFSIN
ncbi:MAG TPA: alpha-amylase family glycosyl hydrolase [Bacteroidales bacterium]|nr:alpha-amylase family glycosyl hydrolase [Bacteroidales bacterium]